MESTLFGFIWRYSKRQQIIILGMTVVSFPILYMTLELPKWIVNDAISGKDFPKSIMGFELTQIPYLIVLCGIFLGLVVLNNGVKYVLNIYKGVSGERMLRRLRYILYNYILRFPLTRFRKVSGGEIIPMITAEVEDVGVFIGEAIATPAFQGGTLLVYIVFIFAQDPFLGAAAVSLYPLQAYVIPKLQRRVIMLTRDRIKNIRVISDRIAETVSAATDIKANDTARYHLADLSDRLFLNYRIRLAIFRRKYMIKFLNNFLNQLPPFFFYSVGGVLVINGSMSFGALVAVLAAYKDLASPWKELLNWYQNLANVSVKYQTVVENFDVDDAVPTHRLDGLGEDAINLTTPTIALSSLAVSGGGSGQEVLDVSMEVKPKARLAVYGRDGSGRSELLLAIAGLLPPIAGRVTIDGHRIDELSHAMVARHVSFVGSEPYIFNDTIRDNIVYSLRTEPRRDGENGGTGDVSSLRYAEATLTGNSLLDISAPWEDYERAGVSDPSELDDRLIELVELVGLEGDLYRLGLAAHLEEQLTESFADKIMTARAEVVRRATEDKSWAGLVELWTSGELNNSATLGENTLFAVPSDPGSRVWEAAFDPTVRDALKTAKVYDLLVDIGASVAATMIELFSDTGADASLIGDYSFLSADEIPLFEQRLRRYNAKPQKPLPQEDADAFVGLAFRLVPGRHRIVTLDAEQEAKIVGAREYVHKALKGNDRYALFDEASYIPPLSVEENILFGKPRVDRRGASERIDNLLRDTVKELGLRDPIARAGLNFEVGVAGGRLSASQRRRIGLVRALVKRPDVLILDAVADGDKALMTRIMDACAEHTLIVGTADPQIAKTLDKVAVMREGRLVAQGPWDSVQQIAIDGVAVEALEKEAS
ncbi:ABC transporter ATP-binding protein/permease [Acuticoccus mangrovi]|uniref:ATP-binding cassette domain-containing protein n=1 Tax=Acuticoccus mangrovi TaxID=2796142 RepID=A0A934IR24_9HYPH|nr:ABC transporter ATP-binding protein/permease [Acuticoccus mangrovi]MBJ3777156.1 ATP-binding cassette domain-containing protein [Acuticoccus mangrovi]